MARQVDLRAPAKVNLTLEVLGRREDGYHELASVMATVDLYDEVRLRVGPTLDVHIRPDVGAPPGADLASAAVRALAAASGREARARVDIRKRIPVAAGLGGGSSDAGAVLRGLAALWRLDRVDLVRVGATVGSDVPFFAAGHPVARIGGRGEHVEELPRPRREMWIALVTLPARVRTPDVFAALDRSAIDASGATELLAAALARGDADPATLRTHARNDLTAAAERVSPPIADARATAAARGIALMLSGSGPSMFAVADDRAHAIRIARSLGTMGLRARPRRLFS